MYYLIAHCILLHIFGGFLFCCFVEAVKTPGKEIPAPRLAVLAAMILWPFIIVGWVIFPVKKDPPASAQTLEWATFFGVAARPEETDEELKKRIEAVIKKKLSSDTVDTPKSATELWLKEYLEADRKRSPEEFRREMLASWPVEKPQRTIDRNDDTP